MQLLEFLQLFEFLLSTFTSYTVLVVLCGSALLGAGAGAIGAYLYVSRQSLLSDAITHATLPGVCAGFLIMLYLGGTGRWLPGLMIGAFVSAGFGAFLVFWTDKNTRLGQEAAIGAVLSVFFGFGVVLLTLIQAIPFGQRAGLEVFLFGSIAGMQRADLWWLIFCALAALLLVLALHRALTLTSFDLPYAQSLGFRVNFVQLTLLFLVLLIVVTGMRFVGLVLIVALLIIPAAAARLWSIHMGSFVALAALFGSASAVVGVLLSASIAKAPTGAVIVLCSFVVFVVSLLASPKRGLVAHLLAARRLMVRVHKRQGLLAMARRELIFDPFTRKVLRRAGLMRADGEPTSVGLRAAADALHQEKLTVLARKTYCDDALVQRLDGLRPLHHLLTQDQVSGLEEQLRMQQDA